MGVGVSAGRAGRCRGSAAAAWAASPPPTRATASRTLPATRRPPTTAPWRQRSEKPRPSPGARVMVAINAMVATQDYAAAIRTAVAGGGGRGGLRRGSAAGAARPRGHARRWPLRPSFPAARAAKLILRRWAKALWPHRRLCGHRGLQGGRTSGLCTRADLLAGTAASRPEEILPRVLAEVAPYEGDSTAGAIPVFVAGGVH